MMSLLFLVRMSFECSDEISSSSRVFMDSDWFLFDFSFGNKYKKYEELLLLMLLGVVFG